MNGPHVAQKTISVVVVGGIGHTDFSATGDLQDVFITPPGVAAYDWEIINADIGATRAGEANVSGVRLVPVDKICVKNMRILISNSADGIYTITGHIRQGFSSGF